MRLALLGADAEALALAVAARAAGHAIVWQDDAAGGRSWSELVDPELADGILVGGVGDSPDERARQVLELAKLGRPLLTVHALTPSVISYFEIDLARGDGGGVLMHFNPLVEWEGLSRLAGWVDAGHPKFGRVEQVVGTRRLDDRSQQRVLWHFARDVELVTRLAGRLDRVGAHAGGEGDAAYGSLSVQLLGPRQIPVRWTVEPGAAGEGLVVTLVCASGRVLLSFDENDHALELVEQGRDATARTALEGPSTATASVTRFAAAVESGDRGASTWPAALDCVELADTIEISLRRGRMIDVHHRELTEQLAFKGVMSAVGCGLLAAVVPLVIVVAWIAGALGVPLSSYWPHLLLAVLAGFLALQFLPKLLAGSSASPRASDSESQPRAEGDLGASESISTD